MDHEARVVRAGKPPPIVRMSGPLAPGPFEGGDWVALEQVTAHGVDFSRRRFEYFATEGSTFVDCDFSRTRFESGSLDGSRTSLFQHCRFNRADVRGLLVGVSRFENCEFRDLRVTDWRVEAAEFIGCRFAGRFNGLLLRGVPPPPFDRRERMIPWRTRNEFRGNDLSQADLRFPDLRNGGRSVGQHLADRTWLPIPRPLAGPP